MATNKTLAPTNVTIAIPGMTDAPNMSVVANCLDKEADAINALNDKFTTLETITMVEGTKSLSSGSFGTLATRSFSPGSYLVVCSVSFQDATTGIRIVMIDTSETDANYVGNSALATGRACLQYFRPITLNTTTTLYFRAYQNSGGDLTVSWRYQFIKL